MLLITVPGGTSQYNRLNLDTLIQDSPHLLASSQSYSECANQVIISTTKSHMTCAHSGICFVVKTREVVA